jgi:uncharacterized short protein YbdD (DUF466 family)
MTIAEVRTALQRAADVVRRVVGVPDYPRYVTHIRTCHPEQTPMTREEFERSRLEDKYSRPGQRCC